MIRYCDDRPSVAGQWFLLLKIQSIHHDTICANWFVAIVLRCKVKTQYWRGLAGSRDLQKTAVFYNIYEGLLCFKGPIGLCNQIAKVGGHV